MAVYEGSRYAEVNYTAITGQDKTTRKWLHPRTAVTQEDVDPDWIVHTVQAGEDLDYLAYVYTNDNADKTIFWWVISDVNDILWPLDIEEGTELIIPLKELAIRGLR